MWHWKVMSPLWDRHLTFQMKNRNCSVSPGSACFNRSHFFQFLHSILFKFHHVSSSRHQFYSSPFKKTSKYSLFHSLLLLPHFSFILIFTDLFINWISWMEEPGGLQSMGSHRVWHDWATSLSFLFYKLQNVSSQIFYAFTIQLYTVFHYA